MPGDTLNIPPIGLSGGTWFSSSAQEVTISTEQAVAAHEAYVQAQSAKQISVRHEKYPLLEEITPVKMKRRVNMPKFRLSFDNLADIQRRLGGVLLYIGGDLYYVREIHEENKEFMLYISDKFGDFYRCPFSHPEINLRSPEPRYIQYQQQPHYFYRPPVREQQQGLSRTNAYVKPVFGTPTRALGEVLIKSLNRHETLSWSSMYSKLMLDDELFESLRLSNTIAFGLKHESRKPILKAEYKGRHLGIVRDDTIFMSELDHDKSWIRRDVEQIACKARVGEKNVT